MKRDASKICHNTRAVRSSVDLSFAESSECEDDTDFSSRASINVTSRWAPIRFSQDNCSFAQGATNSPKPARILASREDRARTPVSIFAVGNEPVVRNETFDATPMAVSLREVEVLKASAHRLYISLRARALRSRQDLCCCCDQLFRQLATSFAAGPCGTPTQSWDQAL